MSAKRDSVISADGDSAVSVKFGDIISESVNADVLSFCDMIIDNPLVIEAVPSYTTAVVFYDPTASSYEEIKRICEAALSRISGGIRASGKLIEIPVVYDGEDIEHVANHAGISIDELVKRHTSRDYLVYMIGFTPGFPYLGGMDETIACPRRDKPRLTVPAGSVGIAGNQTGVYPLPSPGGWQIIGRTGAVLFDKSRDKPALIEAGDTVRFIPV